MVIASEIIRPKLICAPQVMAASITWNASGSRRPWLTAAANVTLAERTECAIDPRSQQLASDI
jgi:hypothetical protein